MPSSYPGALDTLANPDPTDQTNDGDGHAAQHADANDAIEAIQATLGANPEGVTILPGQTGSAGKYLKTDGSDATWETGGGGGGGMTLITSGTFSASSGVSVDTVFDSTYDDYLVLIHCTASTDAELLFRLRVSSTDATTNYTSVRHYGYGGTGGAQTDNTGTDEWQISNLGNTGPKGAVHLTLMSPAIAAYTAVVGQSVGYNSGTGTIITNFGGTHSTATAYDGFTIFPATGNFTGRYAVYGLPK